MLNDILITLIITAFIWPFFLVKEWAVATLSGILSSMIVALMLFTFQLGALCPQYVVGHANGCYVQDVSVKGVFYKTNEIKLFIGDGNSILNVSTNNPNIGKLFTQMQGRMVDISYHRWLIKPYWEGCSEYIIDEVLPDDSNSAEINRNVGLKL